MCHRLEICVSCGASAVLLCNFCQIALPPIGVLLEEQNPALILRLHIL